MIFPISTGGSLPGLAQRRQQAQIPSLSQVLQQATTRPQHATRSKLRASRGEGDQDKRIREAYSEDGGWTEEDYPYSEFAEDYKKYWADDPETERQLRELDEMVAKSDRESAELDRQREAFKRQYGAYPASSYDYFKYKLGAIPSLRQTSTGMYLEPTKEELAGVSPGSIYHLPSAKPDRTLGGDVFYADPSDQILGDGVVYMNYGGGDTTRATWPANISLSETRYEKYGGGDFARIIQNYLHPQTNPNDWTEGLVYQTKTCGSFWDTLEKGGKVDYLEAMDPRNAVLLGQHRWQPTPPLRPQVPKTEQELAAIRASFSGSNPTGWTPPPEYALSRGLQGFMSKLQAQGRASTAPQPAPIQTAAAPQPLQAVTQPQNPFTSLRPFSGGWQNRYTQRPTLQQYNPLATSPLRMGPQPRSTLANYAPIYSPSGFTQGVYRG